MKFPCVLKLRIIFQNKIYVKEKQKANEYKKRG